jgi:diguanylate cyclase (GGDEF)-like protein/PAS domain S-box-containing protein
LLHSVDYHQAKADIMRPLDEFHGLMDRRTLHEVDAATTNAAVLRGIFILLGLGLLFSLWHSYSTLRTTLGGTVDDIQANIARLGRGSFSDAIVVARNMENSVLGWLAQTQHKLSEMESARQQSDAKFKRLARLFAALNACNQAIVRCVSDEELFEQVCRAAVEHGGLKMAWIGLIDRQSGRVKPTTSYGAGLEYLRDLRISANSGEAAGRGPIGITIRENQPYWCQDYRGDPNTSLWHAAAETFGWASVAVLPLHRNDVVIGVLAVYSGEISAFDAQIQSLLVEMTSDIDYALKNFDHKAARTHTEQRDALRSFMMERLTSESPLKQVLRDFVLQTENAMPGALCSCWLLDQAGQCLRPGAAPNLPEYFITAIDGLQIGPGAIACGTAASTGQRVLAGDIATHPDWLDCRELAQRAGLASCWSEPIRSGANQVLGIFSIYHRTPRLPEQHEIELIEMAAHLSAIAIERKHAEVHMQLKAKVFEQSNEAIVITDSQRHIVRVNRAFSQITGYSEAEALGRNPNMLSSGRQDENFYHAMWDSLFASGQWQGELWNRRKDGTVYPEWLSISELRDPGGVVMNYVAIATDITQRKEDEERIRLLADFDPLTGLPNRRLLKDRLDTALRHAQRRGEPLALVFLDLDRFKNVNDSLGHHAGDELLIQVAQRLKSVLREQDTVCRLGGDEFVLLCPDTDAAGAANLATKLLESTVQRHQIGQQQLAITFSIGLALYPTDGDTYDALAMSADAAMYRAKQAGRNGYRFFTSEMMVESSRSLQLENGLRHALELQQLQLVYQPQVSLHDGRVIGTEALLRWHHPTLGQVPPLEFIPIAEDSGLILSIGEWVLRTATRQLREWLDAGLPLRQMSVNLSAVQFRHENLASLVTQVLQEAGLPPQYLELELTESVAMDDPLGAIVIMNKMHQCGIRMSIDDFGTGYSSLHYLKRFRVYKLKIDQSFVSNLTTDPDDKAIVVSIIAMAHNMGFQIVAEGVETQGQLAILQEQGCDEVQGFFYSPPLPADRLEAFLRQHAVRYVGDSMPIGWLA